MVACARGAAAPEDDGHVYPTVRLKFRAEPPPQTRLATDHISEFIPPPGTRRGQPRDPNKFDALSQTMGWAPNAPNSSGSTRAVYDPVAHTTTMYTFQPASVSRQEGSGHHLRKAGFSDLWMTYRYHLPGHGISRMIVAEDLAGG